MIQGALSDPIRTNALWPHSSKTYSGAQELSASLNNFTTLRKTSPAIYFLPGGFFQGFFGVFGLLGIPHTPCADMNWSYARRSGVIPYTLSIQLP